jgi:hypothetical protein
VTVIAGLEYSKEHGTKRRKQLSIVGKLDLGIRSIVRAYRSRKDAIAASHCPQRATADAKAHAMTAIDLL